jgi:predicted RNase H-like nuclease
MHTGIGVDGCRGGWLIVQFDGQQAQARLVSTVPDIQATCTPDTPVWIDMPIGLLTAGHNGRDCDRLARRILSPLRHSSVFTPPCRAAVYVEAEDASAINAQHTGKKLSRQSLNILPKIREVDAYLQLLSTSAQQQWYEAHPEVVFAALHGLQPLPHNKKTMPGQQLRGQLLKTYFAGLPRWLATVREHFPRTTVATDDILDALALAIGSYLVAGGQASLISLPAEPPVDDTGLAMRLVYAAVETS